MRIHDPQLRAEKRSAFTDYMADGIVAQLNPSTIIASPMVDLAAEMRLFDTNYAQLYGADKLPVGHGNLQYLISPSFRVVLPEHRRRVYDEAVAFNGRPEPMWPPMRFWCDAAPCQPPPSPPIPLVEAPVAALASSSSPAVRVLGKGGVSLRQRLVAASQAFLHFLLPLASLPGSSTGRQPVLCGRSLKRASVGDSPGEPLPFVLSSAFS